MITPLRERLCLPMVQAPVFLQSGPEMVIASCRAGVRSTEDLEHWLQKITSSVDAERDARAINLMMHRSNRRRMADLVLALKYQAPIR